MMTRTRKADFLHAASVAEIDATGLEIRHRSAYLAYVVWARDTGRGS